MSKKEKITYVAFYIRVSSKGQATDGYGADVQINLCKKIAEKEGWILYKIYHDPEGVSGDVKAKNRPEFMKMIEDGKKKKFKIVVVAHMDRLGRKGRVMDKALDMLFDANLKIYVNTMFIENTLMGRLVAGIQGQLAQYDKGQLLERMNAGMQKAGIERGERQGPVPYGYKRIGKGKSLRIEPVEYEANVIIRIYEERLKGMKQWQIAEMLNNENIKPPKGKIWAQRAISSLLSTPKRDIYQGGIRNNNESGVCWPKILPDHLHVEIEHIEDSE